MTSAAWRAASAVAALAAATHCFAAGQNSPRPDLTFAPWLEPAWAAWSPCGPVTEYWAGGIVASPSAGSPSGTSSWYVVQPGPVAPRLYAIATAGGVEPSRELVAISFHHKTATATTLLCGRTGRVRAGRSHPLTAPERTFFGGVAADVIRLPEGLFAVEPCRYDSTPLQYCLIQGDRNAFRSMALPPSDHMPDLIATEKGLFVVYTSLGQAYSMRVFTGGGADSPGLSTSQQVLPDCAVGLIPDVESASRVAFVASCGGSSKIGWIEPSASGVPAATIVIGADYPLKDGTWANPAARQFWATGDDAHLWFFGQELPGIGESPVREVVGTCVRLEPDGQATPFALTFPSGPLAVHGSGAELQLLGPQGPAVHLDCADGR